MSSVQKKQAHQQKQVHWSKNIPPSWNCLPYLLLAVHEQPLSKQNKFYLDLYWTQKPTINVENINLRLWQEQLLDITMVDQIEDRKIAEHQKNLEMTNTSMWQYISSCSLIVWPYQYTFLHKKLFRLLDEKVTKKNCVFILTSKVCTEANLRLVLTSLTRQLTFCISYVDVHSEKQIIFSSSINGMSRLKSVVIHF